MTASTPPSDPNPTRPSRRRGLKWLLGGLVVVALLVVVGPFVYINFIADDADPELRLTTEAPSTTIAPSERVELDGTWSVAIGSTAGYRVDEVLFGQNNTATGRTNAVEGTMTIDGTTVTAADISPDDRTLAVMTYRDLLLYPRRVGQSWKQAVAAPPRVVALPWLPQAEAMGWSRDGKAIYVTGEFIPAPLYRVEP